MKLPVKGTAVLGAWLIRALAITWRIQVDDATQVARARTYAPNVVYAFWHGRLLPLAFWHRDERAHVLASEHRDGEMLGQTIRRLGYGHVRGSSTRGGTRAILEMVAVMRSGHDTGFTVDGPRGPRYVAKPGAVEVARLTGAAIVPVTSASRRHRSFASWDRFELPWPFTRVLIRYGEPITVPADADRDQVEAKRVELETTLQRITREADDAVGSRG
jgi:lysophospholipid acyltransferase (LPLAT)-like uncharacterized protein